MKIMLNSIQHCQREPQKQLTSTTNLNFENTSTCEIQILKIIIMLIITSWTHSDTQCFGKGDGWKMIHKGFSDAWPHPCSQLVAAGHCSHAIPSLRGLDMVILVAVAKTLRNPHLWQKIQQFLPALMNWIGEFHIRQGEGNSWETATFPRTHQCHFQQPATQSKRGTHWEGKGCIPSLRQQAVTPFVPLASSPHRMVNPAPRSCATSLAGTHSPDSDFCHWGNPSVLPPCSALFLQVPFYRMGLGGGGTGKEQQGADLYLLYKLTRWLRSWSLLTKPSTCQRAM